LPDRRDALLDQFETVDKDWDRLYNEFPDRYDEFASHQDAAGNVVKEVAEKVDLTDASVLDIGAGSGRYTRDLLNGGVGHVVCAEPCVALLNYARQQTGNHANVEFRNETAQLVDLSGRLVDVVLAAHSLNAINARDFANNTRLSAADADERYRQKDLAMANLLKQIRPGGSLFSVSVVPGGYGGELSKYILGERLDEWSRGKERFLEWLETNYGAKTVVTDGDFSFPSPAVAARVVGFVYGRKVAEVILREERTVIRNPLAVQWIAT
jgi:SAM-dependent methyltransferase